MLVVFVEMRWPRGNPDKITTVAASTQCCTPCFYVLPALPLSPKLKAGTVLSDM